MKVITATLCCSPLILGSCMIGPDYVAPATDIEASWSESDASLASGPNSQVNLEWWKQFNDPTLNNLVSTAADQNLNLRTAALRILESRAILGISQGNMFPQSQAASGDLLRVRAPGNDPNFTTASFGFDAAWELDFWGKFRRSIDSANASLLADIASYDDILVSLTAEVATNYVNIRTLEERIRLAKKNAKLQTDSLELVKLQFEAGTVTELDVLQAQTLLSSTQAQIPNLQTSLQKFHNALAVLLGQSPGSTKSMIATTGKIPQAPTSVGVGVPAELLRRRPDVREAEMLAITQSQQIGIAKADLYPSFTLLGSLGWSASDAGPNELSDIFDADNFGFTFGPAFRWNILNYGRIKNSVRVQDARFEQSLTSYQNVVLNAAREVEDSMTGFVNSKREAEFLRTGVESSERSAELSMLQYKEGLADYQRVLDSTRSLTQKQDQYAATQGTIATNLISMYKALGGGWTDKDREATIPQDIKNKMMQRTDWGKFMTPPQPAVESSPANKK
ncbi:efflux transporter outer membrane subunit [Persicirhabdus sediminis]|uniref:Efflux transporter outer membrane subunit n=1 Tax=Persicirhabdus sediminis TaxID=454144 RepID=A0A8J7MDT3_9BACT|nr:efflux transporter outer membrane subunit [Persicirhabdus sediminis]MBK1790805.1 efflux transporter outer membrane subunit [Persicirhabdus sediminis]